MVAAQQLQEGFSYLENGKYKKAKVFFDQILIAYPNNRVAKLCLGRAVGLAGNSQKAIQIFAALQNKYPNDFEIRLNYAEALLWANRFEEAKVLYSKLTVLEPNNFAARLGYANTLSNLKDYTAALTWVDKALQLDADNSNALRSKKYIRLGYANFFAQNENYTQAFMLLEQNLRDFPNDQESLLSCINLYIQTAQYEQAEKLYGKLARSKANSIRKLCGLALISHKKKSQKKALLLAQTAFRHADSLQADSELKWLAQQRYVQALLWNRKFKLAKKTIQQLETPNAKPEKIESLQATYGMYTGHFRQSISHYQKILAMHPNSFDGNLGLVHAYRASGNLGKAYQAAYQTLAHYPKQKDVMRVLTNLNRTFTPLLDSKWYYTKDNGNNLANGADFALDIPLHMLWRSTLRYQIRNTQNANTKLAAKVQAIHFGAKYKLLALGELQASLGLNTATVANNTVVQGIGEFRLKSKPFPLHNLEMHFRRNLQDFNAELVSKNLVMHTLGLDYNWSTNLGLGWFNQYQYTWQSDRNQRNLWFSSLYFQALHRPIFKFGCNYQWIAFSKQFPEIYFSPNRFHRVALFSELVATAQSKWIYQLSGALGQQYVDSKKPSLTYRIQGHFGRRISDRLQFQCYGKYSNIASTVASGFEFYDFGLLCKWYFLRKPVFKIAVDKL